MCSRATDERNFPNTSWTLIRQSQDVADPVAMAALNRLARAYWRLLVVFARSSGLHESQAQDEMQRMFESILSRDSLRTVMPGESRFRSFLIQCLRNTMISSHRDENREKRGSGAAHEPLENHDGMADAAAESPELAMDRAWAAEVFEMAFKRLEEDAVERGRGEIFAILKPILRGRSPQGWLLGAGGKTPRTGGHGAEDGFRFACPFGRDDPPGGGGDGGGPFRDGGRAGVPHRAAVNDSCLLTQPW